MKKNISKIALKTDRIVSLSKENAKGIVAGAPAQKTNNGLSVCWCNDKSINNNTKTKHCNQLTSMKKNISKIALKTDKIVSLSKENAKGIIAGLPPKETRKTMCGGASVCWCND